MFENVLLWVALAVGFYMAWNIGANDVANAFGCSVGAGALTLRRAILLAAVFEFCGAFFAGSHVAETIKGNIVVPSCFAAQPREFALGMLAALLGASIWLNVATCFGQPVSTTHAIVGAVVGFGLLAQGPRCIQWPKLVPIVASWFLSPVAGGILSYFLYFLIRRLILGSRSPVSRARVGVPVALAAVTFIISFTISRTALSLVFPALRHPAGYAAGLGMVLAGGAGWLGWWVLSRQSVASDEPSEYAAIERWFGRLQILNACFVSFAHGANDVANAIGPLVAVLATVGGQIVDKAGTPAWVLAFGGVGIVVGLATYGYKVIESIGHKITEVTPTRGFSADFGTASTVLVCSLLGLPISTTLVLVGAVMGVGLARGFGAIDLRVVRRIFGSWVVTIPASALATCILYGVLKICLG